MLSAAIPLPIRLNIDRPTCERRPGSDRHSLMPDDQPPAHLLNAVKASASKMKEKQTALDVRAKELEELREKLEAERADVKRRIEAVTVDREALEKEREEVRSARASVDADLALLDTDREKVHREEEKVREAAEAITDRARAIKADEARLERMNQAFQGEMKDAEARLRALVEREDALVRTQGEWMTSFEGREKELRSIHESMKEAQTEAARQRESFAELKVAVEDELNRILAEHEALAAREKSLLEAQEYLAETLGGEPVAAEDAPAPMAAPRAPEPAPAAPPVPEPTPAPAAPPEPVAAPVVVQEDVSEPSPEKPPVTKSEAMDRLAKAVDTWKRARSAGWKVTDIRATVKTAREAVDAGDYDTALRMADGILEQLQAAPAAR